MICGEESHERNNILKRMERNEPCILSTPKLNSFQVGSPTAIKPKKMSNDKSQAADFFHVSAKQAKPFEYEDPFNPQNTLKGFICRKDGPFGGSLFITHINNVKLNEPQKIYGVPKLLYPYVDKKNSDDLEEFEGAEETVPK